MTLHSEPIGEEGLDEIEAEEVLSTFSDTEVVEAQEHMDFEREAPPHGFIVAHTSGGVNRLHFSGECGKTAGIHYRSYTVYGTDLPPLHCFDKRCRNCFPKHGGEKMLAEEAVAVPVGDDSSTHSESGSAAGTPCGSWRGAGRLNGKQQIFVSLRFKQIQHVRDSYCHLFGLWLARGRGV